MTISSSQTIFTRGFDSIQAVDGVSFTVGKQEIFGLLGPNGAGKTTTLRILSTVLRPDSGRRYHRRPLRSWRK